VLELDGKHHMTERQKKERARGSKPTLVIINPIP
jgi:hypothetical protein